MDASLNRVAVASYCVVFKRENFWATQTEVLGEYRYADPFRCHNRGVARNPQFVAICNVYRARASKPVCRHPSYGP
jgi:hypothetical protein